MSFYGWRPYVSVAQRRAQATKKVAQFAKKGQKLSPISIEGRAIANTFWGKAWCEHLESFSDYENRLPRGRTYARNGSILDLQVARGSISGLVMGSSLYKVQVNISPLPAAKWKEIKARSTGQIDSLVELLQGRFSDAVMRVITNRESGLFPQPSEIKKSCSCPDWAGLCKHLAAVLYGVGARLDEKPELLFLLRGVDHGELLEGSASQGGTTGASTIDSAELADVFGIEISSPLTAKPKKTARQLNRPQDAAAKSGPPRKSQAKKPRQVAVRRKSDPPPAVRHTRRKVAAKKVLPAAKPKPKRKKPTS